MSTLTRIEWPASFSPASAVGFSGSAAAVAIAALIGVLGCRLLRRRRRRCAVFLPYHARQPLDQVGIIAGGLLLVGLEFAEDRLDAVDGRKNERYRLCRDWHAIAEFAHQSLGGVRQRFKPRQAEKAASAFDGVNEAKNIAKDAAVIRLLLETHEFGVDEIEALAGLSEKVAQQLVHSRRLVAAGEPPATRRACIPIAGRARRAPSSPGALRLIGRP